MNAGEDDRRDVARARDGDDVVGDELHVTRFATPWGAMTITSTERGLLSCSLPGCDDASALRHAEKHAGGASSTPLPRVDAIGRNTDAVRAVLAYLTGESRTFDLPLDVRGTDFQRDVWRTLVDVPFGATVTYAELGARAGHASAVRAVGMACGANPLPLFVPCHRVVAANGLGGFAGGLELKRRLLAWERGGGERGLFG